MARKVSIKSVEAVGSKSMGTKSATSDNQVRSSRKRQKTQPTSDREVKQNKSGGVQTKTKDPTTQAEPFRFLDLPGEIRNRVYAYATEYTHRCFPPIFPKEPVKESRSRNMVPQRCSPTSPLPYIGLTQVCYQLRSEFRPTWLSTHKIPLCAVDHYLRVFLPHTNPNVSPDVRRRLKFQYSTSGSLRIWIRTSELTDIDILKLVKHAARFPKLKFMVGGGPDVAPNILLAIHRLLKNKTPRWIQGIRSKKISAMRLNIKGFHEEPTLRVVVKERYALPWMKRVSWNQLESAKEYGEALGLGEVAEAWTIWFAVDYS